MQTQVVTLDYEPQPKQRLLHALAVKQILYGGAAGGGKSHSMRWDAIDCCLKNPNCDAYLFRRTRTDLENTHIKRIQKELPEICGVYVNNRNRFEFYNGSYLNMCYAEHDEDVFKYDSVEFHWLGIDEAGHFNAQQLGYLKTRLRTGSWYPIEEYKDFFPRLILSANPGGISHAYLKQKYISGRKLETALIDGQPIIDKNGEEVKCAIFREEDTNWLTAFIPASMRDNKYLDDDYNNSFADVPEWKRKQLVDGDWDVVPGAYFDCWSKRNIIKPFVAPEWWPKFRCVDWGFSQPFWIGECTISDGSPVTDVTGDRVYFPEGAVICIWEWYGQAKGYGHGNQGLKRPALDIAQEVVRRRGKVDYSVAGHDAWKADRGPSPAEDFARAGMPLSQADVSQGSRAAGWQQTYKMIGGITDPKTGVRGDPMFYSFESNVALNSCIPSLETDPDKPEDVLKKGEDHPGDGIRYGLTSRPKEKKEPEKPKPLFESPTLMHLLKNRPEKRLRLC